MLDQASPRTPPPPCSPGCYDAEWLLTLVEHARLLPGGLPHGWSVSAAEAELKAAPQRFAEELAREVSATRRPRPSPTCPSLTTSVASIAEIALWIAHSGTLNRPARDRWPIGCRLGTAYVVLRLGLRDDHLRFRQPRSVGDGFTVAQYSIKVIADPPPDFFCSVRGYGRFDDLRRLLLGAYEERDQAAAEAKVSLVGPSRGTCPWLSSPGCCARSVGEAPG